MAKKSGKSAGFKGKVVRAITATAVALGMSLIPKIANTYEPGTMEDPSIHPLLVDKLIEFYRPSQPMSFDTEQMRAGSINEDSPQNDYKRSFNHFQHWQTGEGLGFLIDTNWMQPLSSSDWATNADVQSQYPQGDHTWTRVEENYRNGHKVGTDFGYIFHLISDLTVPAHVRGDIHPPGENIAGNIAYGYGWYSDPFEYWTNENKEQIMGSLTPVSIPHFSTLPELMTNLAHFTGSHFFSSDTSYDDGTNLQGLTITTQGKKKYYMRTIEGLEMPVLRKGLFSAFPDAYCLRENWKILGTKAVEYGAAALEILARGETDCTPSLSQICEGNDVYQNDGCGNRTLLERCGATQSCQDGNCLDNTVCNNECEEGRTKCEGDSIYECGYAATELTCLEWQFVDNCADYGKVCQNSSCVDVAPSCTNECSSSGQKVCDGNAWKECGNYDNDSCREWSSAYSCVNSSCQNGSCVGSNCTTHASKVCEREGEQNSPNWWVDSCGNRERKEGCWPNERCHDGQCFSVSCSDENYTFSSSCSQNMVIYHLECQSSGNTWHVDSSYSCLYTEICLDGRCEIR